MPLDLAAVFGLTESDRVYAPSEVTTYSTTRPQVVIPVREPARDDLCGSKGAVWKCNRRRSHEGRHARVRYDLGGRVRAVWGLKPWTPPRRVTLECAHCDREVVVDPGTPYGFHTFDCGWCEKSFLGEHVDPRFA